MGYDLVKEILNFAREQNVTLIMINKRIQTRWRNFFFRSLADEVLRYSGDIDVYTITEMVKKPQKKALNKPLTSWFPISYRLVLFLSQHYLIFTLFPSTRCEFNHGLFNRDDCYCITRTYRPHNFWIFLSL